MPAVWPAVCHRPGVAALTRANLLQVRGYGLSSDAHHVTQPPPDGRGAVLAMRRALAAGGLTTADVSCLNAHATSTPIGDAVEAAAIAEVFGIASDADSEHPPGRAAPLCVCS